MSLLEVRGLRVELPRRKGAATVLVDGLDLAVDAGEVVALAGESGSGKSISMLALMGLLPRGVRASGRIAFDGRELLDGARGGGVEAARGREIAMVMQNPMTSLHPLLTVEHQLTEHMRWHLRLDRAGARRRALELLEHVRLPNPERALRSYPHEFSGGMRQRIAIACALACRPRLLIADEPTTALDTTVQAGILKLLDDLRRDDGLAVVLITHDLGVVAALADRLAVLYSGRLAETGTARALLEAPRHPYTRALLDSLPDPKVGDQELIAVRGAPPAPNARPPGCAFHPRCGFARDGCREAVPALAPLAGARELACPVDPLRR